MWKLFVLMLLAAVAANAESKFVCGLDINGDGVFQEPELTLGAKAKKALDNYYKIIDALNADTNEEPKQVLPTPQEAHRRLVQEIGDLDKNGKAGPEDYRLFLIGYACHEN